MKARRPILASSECDYKYVSNFNSRFRMIFLLYSLIAPTICLLPKGYADTVYSSLCVKPMKSLKSATTLTPYTTFLLETRSFSVFITISPKSVFTRYGNLCKHNLNSLLVRFPPLSHFLSFSLSLFSLSLPPSLSLSVSSLVLFSACISLPVCLSLSLPPPLSLSPPLPLPPSLSLSLSLSL